MTEENRIPRWVRTAAVVAGGTALVGGAVYLTYRHLRVKLTHISRLLKY